MSLVKLALSTMLALSLLVGGMVTPALADGTVSEPECEEVPRTITENGSYGQQTQYEVKEKVCKVEVINSGLDAVTTITLASLVTLGVGALALQKKLA